MGRGRRASELVFAPITRGMTKRQPKGTPVGGQFAEGRKPEGAELTTSPDEKTTTVKCSDCQTEIDPLDVFPEGRCLNCHAAVTPMPTAEEVRRAWGIR